MPKPRPAVRHWLDPVLRPRSVAVVGASSDPGKRGNKALGALQAAGYGGAVYPVNPKGGTILGHRVYPSLAELPESPDLALVCRPAQAVPGVVAECGKKGIFGAVALAVGFEETGERGRRLAEETLAEARRWGVRIVGPNTSGILNLHEGLNLIGASGMPIGGIGLLVQSGNIALDIANSLGSKTREGISTCVGLGNALDLGFADFLDFMADDPNTAAVVVHAEGFDDVPRFLRMAARAVRRKPVIAIRGGRSEAGRRAALSHTGAMSHRYELVSAGLRQAGAIEVDRLDELAPLAAALASRPEPRPDRKGSDAGIVLLTDGGGQGTLASDRLSGLGVPLAKLDERTRTRLRGLLGPAAAVANPVDVAGAADGDPSVFAAAFGILASDDSVGAALLVGLFGGYAVRFGARLGPAEEQAAAEMARCARRHDLPLVAHSMYAGAGTATVGRLLDESVPVVESLEAAVRCVAEIWRRGQAASKQPWEPAEPERRRALPTSPKEMRAERVVLSEPEATRLLTGFGVRFPPQAVCRTEADLGRAAVRLGFPLVLKAVSPDLPHKTEAKAVALGIGSLAEAKLAFRKVLAGANAHLARSTAAPAQPGIHRSVEEALAVETLPPPVAELLVAVRRDRHVGPVLTLGAGGIRAEAEGDLVHRLLPVSERDMREMIDSLRVSIALGGFRGRPAADVEAVIATMRALAECLLARDDLLEAEINPLFALPRGAFAADALVTLAASV